MPDLRALECRNDTRLLWAYGNQIKNLRVGTFDQLPELRGLLLRDNQIKDLQAGMFDKLTELRRLIVRNNPIKEIGFDTFFKLIELEELRMENLHIKNLQDGIFDELKKLHHLCNLWIGVVSIELTSVMRCGVAGTWVAFPSTRPLVLGRTFANPTQNASNGSRSCLTVGPCMITCMLCFCNTPILFW